MKILSIVSARPQFIKEFAVGEEVRKNNTEVLVHTGQHYDWELSSIHELQPQYCEDPFLRISCLPLPKARDILLGSQSSCE